MHILLFLISTSYNKNIGGNYMHEFDEYLATIEPQEYIEKLLTVLKWIADNYPKYIKRNTMESTNIY